MSGNKDLENIMKQKLDAFRMEPADADWNAIYRQLHPRRRRGLLWLILPAALLVGAAGYYFYDSRTAVAGVSVKSTKATKALNIPHQERNIADTLVAQKTIARKNLLVEGQEQQVAQQETYTAQNKTVTVQQEPTIAQQENYTSQDKRVTARQKPNTVHRQPTTPTNAFAVSTSPSVKTFRSGISKEAMATEVRSAVSGISANPAGPSPGEVESTAPQVTARMATVNKWFHPIFPPGQPPLTVSPDVFTRMAPLPTGKPSRIKTTDKWHMGGYISIGINMPSTADGGQKMLDMSIPNTPTGAGTVSFITTQYSSALHWSAGVSLQRDLGRWRFFTGVGLQSNAWKGYNTRVERTSTTNGSFMDSTRSTSVSRIRQTGIELPLMMGIALLQARESGLYLQAGLNNLVVTRLNSSINTPLFPLRYQPQLRAGLLYQHHSGQRHWQAGPFVQYGVARVTNQADMNIRNIQAGIQILYLWR